MSIRPNRISWVTRFGLFGFLVAIALCVGGIFLVRYLYRTAALHPFQSSLEVYLAAAPGEQLPTEQPPKPGMIAVNIDTKSLDHFYFDLPEDLRAASPADVKTVLFLRWERLQTHKYSSGRPGYTQICQLDVVDLETKKLLKSMDFKGSPPPSSISSRQSSGQGSSPADQVVLFLQQNTPR